MGEDVRPDLAEAIEVMIAIQENLEERWVVARTGEEKRSIEELMCFLLADYCSGLRGD